MFTKHVFSISHSFCTGCSKLRPAPPIRRRRPESLSRFPLPRPGQVVIHDFVSGQLSDPRAAARSNAFQNPKACPMLPPLLPKSTATSTRPWLPPLPPRYSSSFSRSPASPSPPPRDPSRLSRRRRRSSSSPPTPPTVPRFPLPLPNSKLTRAVSQISVVPPRRGCPARRVPAVESRLWPDGEPVQ